MSSSDRIPDGVRRDVPYGDDARTEVTREVTQEVRQVPVTQEVRQDYGQVPAAPTGARGASEVGGLVDSQKDTILEREREEHGGFKFGAAFFGWLAATGMAVLLTALLSAAGTALGIANDVDAEAVTDAADDPQTVGLIGAAVLLVILFIAYFCGGYVAGRMARFDGAKQGVAVWLWAVVIAVALAILGLVLGREYNVLGALNAFPRIPVDEGDLTTGGIIALVLTALVALVGAILGGLTGMRYHRRVDRTGAAATIR